MGRFQGLWCREFLGGKELGSAENFGCSGAVSGVERLRDGGAAMLGFWVRLGEELGAVYGLEPAWFQGKRRVKLLLVSEEEEGGECWEFSLDSLALSLG